MAGTVVEEEELEPKLPNVKGDAIPLDVGREGVKPPDTCEFDAAGLRRVKEATAGGAGGATGKGTPLGLGAV